MAMAGKTPWFGATKVLKNFNFMRNIMKFFFFFVLLLACFLFGDKPEQNLRLQRALAPGFLVPSCTLWYSKNLLENHDVYILVWGFADLLFFTIFNRTQGMMGCDDAHMFGMD